LSDRPDLSGLTALVVDDNQVNRRVLFEQLARCGVSCTMCPSGDDALAALSVARTTGASFDFALLDFQMPGMDGAVLATRIRARPEHRELPILILSSVRDPMRPEQIEGLGIARVLKKPVREAQLLRVIAGSVGRNVVEGRAPSQARDSVVATGDVVSWRVLLVEDNRINQIVARRMLEKLGCSVDVAANGRDGVSMASHGGYDLILMDVQMPIMDGYEATAGIRRDERISGRHTPIVALTANAMERDARECLDSGMDDYIAKPMRLADLQSIVDKWTSVTSR
jgi:CheY-like chemotaxis protein